MNRLIQAILVLAVCFALAPFVLANEHGRERDHDREEHHDRGHHYAYGHYKHHHQHDWDRERDQDRDWDRDRRADWRRNHKYRRPVTTVVNNRVPVKIAGPHAGEPIIRHTAPPKVAGEESRGEQSQSTTIFGPHR